MTLRVLLKEVSPTVVGAGPTVVGAGIMALPAIVRVLGLIPGLLAIVAAAALAQRSLDFVLRVGRSSSYVEAVGDALGEVGRRLLLGCVVLNNFWMLLVYITIIGNVLSRATSPEDEVHHRGVLQKWFGTEYWWNESGLLLLLTSVLVFSPLICFKRRLDTLKTSALSLILAVVFVVITAGIAIVKVINGSISMPRLLPHIVDWEFFWKLFTTVSVLVTAYICHYSIHSLDPVENGSRDPRQMKSIVRASLGLCCMIYIATNFFGFLLFRAHTLDVVLADIDTDFGFATYGSLLNDVVMVCYAVHLMLVFPSIFDSLLLDLADLLFPRAVAPLVFDSEQFSVVTFVLTLLVLFGASSFSSVRFAFQIIGATAAVAIGFIFPAAIALWDVHGRASRNDKALSWLMMLVALSSCTVAIASGVYGLF